MTGLPDGTVARMQRLAEQRTAHSHPFPALDRSIRRDRRIRFGGAAVVLAAVLAAGTIVGAEALDGGRNAAVPAGVQELPQIPEDAGYPAKTVGSLSADRVWLDGLRQRVASASDFDITSADDVRVVAAGDIESKARYALVLYPSTMSAWTREFWTGPFQAEPAAMRSGGSHSSEDSGLANPVALVSLAGDRVDDHENLQDPLVIVSAPKATTVSVLTSSRLDADGKYTEKWRELGPPATDGLWATSISPDEHLLGTAQVDGKPIYAESGLSLRDQEGNELYFGSVAPAGSDLAQLRELPESFVPPGPGARTMDEEPVYAATSQVNGLEVAVGLLRAPSGAYITGFFTSDPDGVRPQFHLTDRKIVPAGPAPDSVMAGMRATGEKKTYGVVLAPKNAVEVRIGQFSAPVQNRIAIVEVQAARDATLPVTAVDERGQEVGRITLPAALPSAMP